MVKSKDGDGRKLTGVSGNKIEWYDAVGIKPKLVPDYELLPRDDSGGPDYEPYTMEFGDGGYVLGEKSHLSTDSGTSKDDPLDGGDEIDQRGNREEDSREIRKRKTGHTDSASDRDTPPASSKKYARE